MPGEKSEVSASSQSPFTSIVDFLPNDTALFKLSVQQEQVALCQAVNAQPALTSEDIAAIWVDNHQRRYSGTVIDILRRELLIFILCCPNVYRLMEEIFSRPASDDYYTQHLQKIAQFYITNSSNSSFNYAIAEWAARELAKDLQDHLTKDINSESSKNLIKIFNQLLELGSITAYEQPIVILLKLFKAEIISLMRSDPALLREILGYYQDPESYPRDAKVPLPYAVQLFFKLTELLQRSTSLSEEMKRVQANLSQHLKDFIASVEREMQKPEEYHPHQACGLSLRLA
jgi:hypothetical protein